MVSLRQPLNTRQLEVLSWIADGCPDGVIAGHAYKHSAGALRDRRLVTVSKKGGIWRAEVTPRGAYYLAHGRHPDDEDESGKAGVVQSQARDSAQGQARPAEPGAEHAKPARRTPRRRPTNVALTQQRRASAEKLVAQLLAEGRVLIEQPGAEELATWRKVVDFAKRYRLTPEGKRIEKAKLWDGNLRIELVDGQHFNSRGEVEPELRPVPVPTQLRSLHPVVAKLRDDPQELAIPEQLRRRCLRILQAVAKEAEQRGYPVSPYRRDRQQLRYHYGGPFDPPQPRYRDGALAVGIGGFTYHVTVKQETPNSADSERAQRLQLVSGAGSWADRKRWKVEDTLAALFAALEKRAVADEQQRLAEERARAERQRHWEAAMARAKERAIEAHFAEKLTAQAERWRHAAELRSYCAALAERLARADETTNEDEPAETRQWLQWARDYAERLDPLQRLPTMPNAPELKPDDLRPYLGEWSPYGPDSSPSWSRRW